MLARIHRVMCAATYSLTFFLRTSPALPTRLVVLLADIAAAWEVGMDGRWVGCESVRAGGGGCWLSLELAGGSLARVFVRGSHSTEGDICRRTCARANLKAR